jgi:hypothetical protein
MVPGVVEIATGVVAKVSPFLPYLVSLAKGVGKKLEDVIAEKGGQAAWSLAQTLWNKLIGAIPDDEELTTQAKSVALSPHDKGRQETLAEVLAQHLQDRPDLAQDLLKTIGGPQRLQEIIGGDEAQIERIHQKMAEAGIQRVQGGQKAKISDVTQEQ